MLGSGSFSTVFLAEHLKLKLYRAIKRIPRHPADKTSFSLKTGFPPEAELLKHLNHPGIPLIYDIDEDDDYLYIIEEFIQGESLDTFVSHQKTISQELIVKLGIQLCDILDYLHHLSPYPILYQDLKPEHIILCGNQLKLIDFGIASFFTGSGKHFQIYGTDGFAAPEARNGLPVTLAADIYSLGKVLEFLISAADSKCSDRLLHIVKRATAKEPDERYPSAADAANALLHVQKHSSGHSSHLIRNIAVIGSRPGAGATHFAVSLVCTLRKRSVPALYMAAGKDRTLDAIARANPHFKERDGIFYYEYFKGVPDYGDGVFFPLPADDCIVKDFGTDAPDLAKLETSDFIFFLLSGADWDFTQSVTYAKQLALFPQTVFVCNHGNKRAAGAYAKHINRRVYCFPNDPDPYRVSAEKERLISSIFPKKGGNIHFSL